MQSHQFTTSPQSHHRSVIGIWTLIVAACRYANFAVEGLRQCYFKNGRQPRLISSNIMLPLRKGFLEVLRRLCREMALINRDNCHKHGQHNFNSTIIHTGQLILYTRIHTIAVRFALGLFITSTCYALNFWNNILFYHPFGRG